MQNEYLSSGSINNCSVMGVKNVCWI